VTQKNEDPSAMRSAASVIRRGSDSFRIKRRVCLLTFERSVFYLQPFFQGTKKNEDPSAITSAVPEESNGFAVSNLRKTRVY